ncbi:hypothetical protein [Sulfurimonas sp. C5]|uniref:hypothetical protein n=1 Tax=Sulfurimonas sp. C5 TaxID=3036947 RepID=UPI002454CDDD|nr:hypothetical protein [Sulfurimonas sp. C5]MDH4944111.1 hypothetical protein [Sulfurimonas sp. C5]
MLKQLMLLSMVVFFFGCSSDQPKEIRIATNSWIGYSPLFYANETGELKKLNMKLVTNVSLAEASDIFEVAKAELVTTTQHEYFSLKESVKNVIPIILIDRSDGGDMILSNRTQEQLYKDETIYAYLESDSINNELLAAFLEKKKLTHKNIVYINEDQLQISDLDNNTDKSMLIVTYSPYNLKLETKGFKELASTKDINSLIVIDALCAKTSIYKTEKKRLQELKIIIDNAIEEINTNPQKVYKLVAKYLDNMSYEEFLDSLNSIKWINKNPPQELMEKIEHLGYKEAVLIK